MILGPAIAAPVFVAFGAEWALLFNALSFAISYLTIYAMRATGGATSASQKQRGSFLREFWEGVRFYFSSRVLVTLLVAIIVGVSGASALNALDIFFTTQNLGASTVMYGFIGAVYGLGAIIGSILLAMVASRIGLARLLWVSMALMGVIVMVLSRLDLHRARACADAGDRILERGAKRGRQPAHDARDAKGIDGSRDVHLPASHESGDPRLYRSHWLPRERHAARFPRDMAGHELWAN